MCIIDFNEDDKLCNVDSLAAGKVAVIQMYDLQLYIHNRNNELISVWICLYRTPVQGNADTRNDLEAKYFVTIYPDSKIHGANMGSTWVLSAPDGPHVDPMNLAIGVCLISFWGTHAKVDHGCGHKKLWSITGA